MKIISSNEKMILKMFGITDFSIEFECILLSGIVTICALHRPSSISIN